MPTKNPRHAGSREYRVIYSGGVSNIFTKQSSAKKFQKAHGGTVQDKRSGVWQMLRTRSKNPSGYSQHAVSHLRRTLRRQRVSAARRAGRHPRYTIITATRGKHVLKYDGLNFSNKHAPRKFVSVALAVAKAKELIRKFPVLRGYAVHVKRAH